MNKTDIAKLRLRNQRIDGTEFSRAEDVVSWFGAVQAQDYQMAKWALGLRMTKATSRSVEDEIDAGSVFRTHVMRPTWHFVAAADIRWMLELTAPRIEIAARPRQRHLELDGRTLNRTTKLIAKALEGENHLTRPELMSTLQRSGIKRSIERGIHIMLQAELDGVVCNGKRRGKQFTYALMDERVPETKAMAKDEALAKLATRYFTSHGPAALKDFTWWSGLAAADARTGLESIKSTLVSDAVDGQVYWMQQSVQPQRHRKSVRLLPAFDEFTVSYKDRSASVAPELMKDVTVGHAIFRPIVVIDGRVVGVWIRRHVKRAIDIVYTLFEDLSKSEQMLLVRGERQYRHFEGNGNRLA
jgi:hypothetical protein